MVAISRARHALDEVLVLMAGDIHLDAARDAEAFRAPGLTTLVEARQRLLQQRIVGIVVPFVDGKTLSVHGACLLFRFPQMATPTKGLHAIMFVDPATNFHAEIPLKATEFDKEKIPQAIQGQ
jgi:hypothetical protein